MNNKVQTPACLVCGEGSVVYLTDDEYVGYMRWQRGELIQVAMPTVSASVRETIMTGTHPACWDKMFGE